MTAGPDLMTGDQESMTYRKRVIRRTAPSNWSR